MDPSFNKKDIKNKRARKTTAMMLSLGILISLGGSVGRSVHQDELESLDEDEEEDESELSLDNTGSSSEMIGIAVDSSN